MFQCWWKIKNKSFHVCSESNKCCMCSILKSHRSRAQQTIVASTNNLPQTNFQLFVNICLWRTRERFMRFGVVVQLRRPTHDYINFGTWRKRELITLKVAEKCFFLHEVKIIFFSRKRKINKDVSLAFLNPALLLHLSHRRFEWPKQ